MIEQASSNAINFSTVNFGFTVADLLASATSLISAFGQWLLLGLALMLAPVLVNFIKGIVASRRAAKSE